MSSLEDLERRIGVVEDELVVVRQEAASARALASGADRDVADYRAELRSHTRVLNALRETQLEQGQILAEHGQILAEHGQILAEHGQILLEQGQALRELTATVGHIRDQHGAGLNHITELLTELIDRDNGQQ